MVRRIVRRSLAGLAAAAGVLAAVPVGPAVNGAAIADEIARGADRVTAIELAEWIRARRPGLRVIDVRDSAAYDAYHVPSAERLSLPALARLRPAAGETLVLYSDGPHAAQAWALLRSAGVRGVYVLRGGLLDWTEGVMNPAVGTDSASARVAALSRYFGGSPRLVDDSLIVPTPAPDVAAAVARLRRRGC